MSGGGRGVFVWIAATVVSVGLALAAVAVARDSVDGPSLEAIDAALEASPEAGDGESPAPSPAETVTPPTDEATTPAPGSTATEADDDGPTTRPSTTSTPSTTPSATSSPSSAPSTGGTSTPTPSPSPSPSASPSDDDDDDDATPSPSPSARAEGTVRSATAIGGRASFRVVGGQVELLGATPEPGFTVKIERGDAEVKVTFTSPTHESEIKADLEDGALDVSVDEESEVDD